MTERAYTVKEIDALRRACEYTWLYGTTKPGGSGGVSRAYRREEKDAGVEQLVRTYMLAGLTAEDIYAADSPSPQQQEMK